MLSNIVLIGGTPGVGKSTIGHELSRQLKAVFLDLNELAKREEIILKEDPDRQTKIVNPQKLQSHVSGWVLKSSGWGIITGHYIDLLKLPNVILIIILRTSPFILRKRLQLRNWKPEKILENVQAEVLGVCISDAKNQFPDVPIIEINTNQRHEDVAINKILQILTIPPDELKNYQSPHYDWLTELTLEELKLVFPE